MVFYMISLVYRKDGSSLDFLLAVIHPKTEVVVLSIDGSFAARMSSTGLPPSVRQGSVDVVRFWEQKGYLIVYITGRPEMQLQKVKSWLYEYKFPRGMLSFADSYAPDPLGHKAYYLRNLIKKHEVVVCAAYSNSKDIGIYSSINLKPEQIFILGEVSRKQRALVDALGEDYRQHLDKLKSSGIHKPHTLAPECINFNDNSSYNL
ncbi:hypothetical protein J437_LFUL008597 [Ladona fulva]|uniref:LNS2/PITP domain-containing protein n=1 Tax=Ladona fulva TaxID=123851 RepID=A0A8K0K8T2_LADFU|nr:hypothetical protein J437_LFUL008597 [Ladona fulva]